MLDPNYRPQYGAYNPTAPPKPATPPLLQRPDETQGAAAAANPFMQQMFGGGPAAGAPPAGGVSGGDFIDAFVNNVIAKHLAAQDALAPKRLEQGNELLFGRHLGTGGGEVTPENPTGNAANPWAEGGLFAGNATNLAAQRQRKNPYSIV